MVTRGYNVYHCKGRYYVYYNHYDTYPSIFGLQALDEIPRNVSKEEFEEWVKKTREYVYAQRDSQLLNDPDDLSNYVSDKQPKKRPLYRMDLRNRLGLSRLPRRLSAPISFGQYATGRSMYL